MAPIPRTPQIHPHPAVPASIATQRLRKIHLCIRIKTYNTRSSADADKPSRR